jgi:hypothetical protein
MVDVHMHDSKETPRYLYEPNYYRLAYQQAAQRINRALPLRENAAQPPAPNDEYLRDADINARRLAKDVRLILNQFQHREANVRWWRPGGHIKRLTTREKRLQRFLYETVEPCINLVIAGVLVYRGRVKDGDEKASPFRQRADRADHFSYRAYYNLACYEVARGEVREKGVDSERFFTLALEHIGQAFASTHSADRRAGLARWASQDPSLDALRHRFKSRFDDLLARYAKPDPKANIYTVSPKEDGWLVKHNRDTLATFPKKREAIDFAMGKAEADPPSQMVIQGDDGRPQEVRTYEDRTGTPATNG